MKNYIAAQFISFQKSVFYNFFAYFLIFQILGIILYMLIPNSFLIICKPIGICTITILIRNLLEKGVCYSNKNILILPLAVCLGIFSMHSRILNLDTHFIKEPIKNIEIVGEVKGIKNFEDKVRILVEVQNNENIKKVRVKAKKLDLRPGDLVKFRANIFPPTNVILKDAFDFEFYFYFLGINAVGYVNGNLKVLEESRGSSIINGFRRDFEAKTEDLLSKESAAVINALITGNANGLSKKTKEQIRNTGVAHVFAISGMHMGLIVFFSFFMFKSIFKRITYILIHYDINKISSVFAIIFGLFYLFLSDFAVSAQRAYIMSCIFLLSILIVRRLNLFNNLMVAGIVILSLTPEALMHPSMQMSFAACLGLIVVYEKCFSKVFDTRQWYKKFLRYFIMLFISTVVASIFTLPFSIYHFQKFSSASFISNLIVVPIAEFIVMPVCFLCMFLLPLNMEFLIKLPAECSAQMMLKTIEFFYNLQLPNFFISKIHISSLIIFGLLGISLKIFNRFVRLFFALLLVFSFCLNLYESYNLIYDPQENKMIKLEESYIMLNGDFSSIERKMIESYYNKKVKFFDSDKYLKDLMHNSEKGFLYYAKFDGQNILKIKRYEKHSFLDSLSATSVSEFDL